MNDVYISNGVEKFFHTPLPHWANFSSLGRCERSSEVRFLNFNNLSKSYGLTYTQSLHVQHMYNRKLSSYRRSTDNQELSIKDQSFIFFNVYEQVSGGGSEFTLPAFKNVSVLWIDPLIALKDGTKKIKRIVNSNDFLSGHPVLLSSCLTSFDMEALAQKLKLDILGVKLLSAEMFNIYSQDLKRRHSFTLDLNSILTGKKIKLYGTYQPQEIEGEYEFIKIK